MQGVAKANITIELMIDEIVSTLDNTNLFLELVVVDDKIPDTLYETKNEEENMLIQIKKTNYLKCIRCWKFEEEVEVKDSLCLRCKKTLACNE